MAGHRLRPSAVVADGLWVLLQGGGFFLRSFLDSEYRGTDDGPACNDWWALIFYLEEDHVFHQADTDRLTWCALE